MFTIEQIYSAHSKVKSGADFPAYIKDLKLLGVEHYETLVKNNVTTYFGTQNFNVSSSSKYDDLIICEDLNLDQFKNDLKDHQLGKTDYFTFCKDCAKSGIYKWVVCLSKGTCTYLDSKNNEVLIENIPQ